MSEAIVYINEGWHTGQVREATDELVDTSLRVVDRLIPVVQGINPDLNSIHRAALIKTEISPDVIPLVTRSKWVRDENWLYRFIDSLRDTYTTPSVIDGSITGL